MQLELSELWSVPSAYLTGADALETDGRSPQLCSSLEGHHFSVAAATASPLQRAILSHVHRRKDSESPNSTR